jgi:hypothetical protein
MRQLPQKITEGLTTTSDKIRALAAAGYERTEIAAFLAIRYQHVRNVLVQSNAAKSSPQASIKSRPLPEPRLERIAWQREQLLDAGFVLLGEWRSTSDAGFELSTVAPVDAGVYAFVVDGAVRYIGLTQTGIRSRLGHYKYGYARQRTSARVKGLILEALSAGSKIEVLIAFPPQLVWNGLPVDGAAGLEAGLLRAACPTWNKQGVTPRVEAE